MALMPTMVQAPVSLVRDHALSPVAKLLWLIIGLDDDPDAARITRLERRTGLSRKTVSRAMAELIAAGWNATAPVKQSGSSTGETVQIPVDLLVDGRVRAGGRILYGYLQLLPSFRYPTGQFTYADLGRLTGDHPRTVRGAVRDLAAAGWLQISQRNRQASVCYRLCDPLADRGQAEVDRAERRLAEAPFLGEALMREYLSLLVDSEDFEDNAAPGFLVNPWTDERMELDRFYPPGTAFEFNGPQHYGATERYSEENAAKQRGRDYMKLGICASRGIRLVVIHPEDLALATMRQKIGQILPLRDLRGHEPLIAFLESVSRRYRRAAKRNAPGTLPTLSKRR